MEEYREITRSIKTATLIGEDRYTREAFRDLIERHAIRVIGPDLATAGGIAETKKIAELSELHGLSVALHFAGSPLSMIANVLVATTTPNVIAVEFHAAALPWWDSPVKGVDKPIVKDGYAEVPDSPGLGAELSEEEIRKHPKLGERYFE